MNTYAKRRATIVRKAREAARAGIAGNPYRRADDSGLFATVYNDEVAQMEREPVTIVSKLEAAVACDDMEKLALELFDGAKFPTLDAAQDALQRAFPGWFVYRGGNHVALHRAQLAPRVLIVTDTTPRVPARVGRVDWK